MKLSKKIKIVLAIVVVCILAVAEASTLRTAVNSRLALRSNKESRKRNEATSKSTEKSTVTSSRNLKSLTSMTTNAKSKQGLGTLYDSTKPGCVKVFSEPMYQGDSMEICDNVPDYSAKFPKPIKSWIVNDSNGSFYTFVYFFDTNYKGESWSSDTAVKLYEDTRVIKSSYIVKKGCAVFYRECNYTDKEGAVYTCDLQNAIGKGKLFPDKSLSSLITTQSAIVTVFDNVSHTGRNQTFTAYHSCLKDIDFDKKTSSIKILAPADLKTDTFIIPKFNDGTSSYTHNSDTSVKTVYLSDQLPSNFELNFKIIQVIGLAFNFGICPSIEAENEYVGGGNSECWSLSCSGNVVEQIKRDTRNIGGPRCFLTGDKVTFKGNDGLLTFAVNDVFVNYSYQLQSKTFYAGFSFGKQGFGIELISLKKLAKIAKIGKIAK